MRAARCRNNTTGRNVTDEEILWCSGSSIGDINEMKRNGNDVNDNKDTNNLPYSQLMTIVNSCSPSSFTSLKIFIDFIFLAFRKITESGRMSNLHVNTCPVS